MAIVPRDENKRKKYIEPIKAHICPVKNEVASLERKADLLEIKWFSDSKTEREQGKTEGSCSQQHSWALWGRLSITIPQC